MFYLVKEEVKGYITYVTEADSPEQAIDKCAKTEDTYGVDTAHIIEEETITEATEIDLDNLDEMDHNIQRAVKWLNQDAQREPEDEPKKKKRKKKKSAKKVEAPEPIEDEYSFAVPVEE